MDLIIKLLNRVDRRMGGQTICRRAFYGKLTVKTLDKSFPQLSNKLFGGS